MTRDGIEEERSKPLFYSFNAHGTKVAQNRKGNQMEERQQFSKIDKLIAQIDMAVFLVKHSRLKNLESFDCDTSETWREFLKKVSQLETDVKQLTYTINQEKEV